MRRQADLRHRQALRITGVVAGKRSVPGRSREQRLRALRHANEVRSARAKLKRELAAGEIELAQILVEPPSCVRMARVRDLLLVLPKIGSVKAGRILAQCGIACRIGSRDRPSDPQAAADSCGETVEKRFAPARSA